MADKLSLDAQKRQVLGKKVKKLRKDGQLPAHVYGKGLETEVVSVDGKTFLKTFEQTGETGLIYLKIGAEKVRPVLIRGVQYDPINGHPLHIDFYQVNLTQKVKAPIPLVLIGDQPELVKSGEAIVLQTLNEVEVEALPADLIEKIEVDIANLKNIDDAITVGQLQFDRSKLTVHAPDEEIVVKLAPAITEEMKKQMEEEAAAAAAAAAEVQAAEGEAPSEGEAPAEGEQAQTEVAEAKEETPASAESSEGKPKE